MRWVAAKSNADAFCRFYGLPRWLMSTTRTAATAVWRRRRDTEPEGIPPDMLHAYHECKKSRGLLNEDVSSLLSVSSSDVHSPHFIPLESFFWYSTTMQYRFKHSDKYSMTDIDLKETFVRPCLDNILQYNSSEIGLFLKCMTKCNLTDEEVVLKCIERLKNRKLQFSWNANYYALESIHNSCAVVDTSTYQDLVNNSIRNISKTEDINELARIIEFITAFKGLPTSFTSSTIDTLIEEILSHSPTEYLSDNSIRFIIKGMRAYNVKHLNFLIYTSHLLEEGIYYYSTSTLLHLSEAYSTVDEGSISQFTRSFELIGNELAKNESLPITSICAAANAFANSQICHELFFKTKLPVVSNHRDALRPWQVSNLLHAYSAVGLQDDPQLSVLWTEALKQSTRFSLHDIQWVMKAYLKMKYPNVDVMKKLCHECEEHFGKFICTFSGSLQKVEGCEPFNVLFIAYCISEAGIPVKASLINVLSTAASYFTPQLSVRDIVQLSNTFGKILSNFQRESTVPDDEVAETDAWLRCIEFFEKGIKVLQDFGLNNLEFEEVEKLLECFVTFDTQNAKDFLYKLVELPHLDYSKLETSKLQKLVSLFHTLDVMDSRAFSLCSSIIRKRYDSIDPWLHEIDSCVGTTNNDKDTELQLR